VQSITEDGCKAKAEKMKAKALEEQQQARKEKAKLMKAKKAQKKEDILKAAAER